MPRRAVVWHAGPRAAAAPLVGKQAPGFYRYKVGDIEVTVVTDGVARGKLLGELRDQRA